MAKEKKGKKKNHKLWCMLYSAVTLLAFVADLYFIQQYPKLYIIICAVSVVMVTGLIFLVDEMVDLFQDGRGQEGGASKELADLVKLQKAMYVNSKSLLEELNTRVSTNASEMIAKMDANKNEILETEKRIGKAVIKNNKENTEEVIKNNKETAEATAATISNIQIEAPKVELPEIKIPEIQMPEIKVPEIKLPEGIGAGNSEEIQKVKNEILQVIQGLSEDIKKMAKMEDVEHLKKELVGMMGQVEARPVVASQPVTPVEVTAEPEVEPAAEIVEPEPAVEITEPVLAEEKAVEPEPIEEMEVEEALGVLEDLIGELNLGGEAVAEPEVEPEPVVESEPEPEPIVEEAPAAPVIEPEGDPNRQLSPDEIAAMFASVEAPAAEPEPIVVEAPAAEPEPIVEEAPAAPVIEPEGDPNRQLSPDEIAAMFASVEALADEPATISAEAPAAEPVVEPEPEPVVEEAPAAPVIEPDGDPNRQLSPEEIAALFAGL